MILGWFDARDAEEFGKSLAEFYDKQSQVNAGAKESKMTDKQQKLVAQVLVKAQQFRTSHKLNLYKKAKLGNAFRWKLRDLGHDVRVIDMITKDLMYALR
jgi:hypothetical protein